MANITITIPADQVARVTDALCDSGGYQATLPDGSANPMSKAAFAKAQVIRLIKDVVQAQEVTAAARAASATTAPDLT